MREFDNLVSRRDQMNSSEKDGCREYGSYLGDMIQKMTISDLNVTRFEAPQVENRISLIQGKIGYSAYLMNSMRNKMRPMFSLELRSEMV